MWREPKFSRSTICPALLWITVGALGLERTVVALSFPKSATLESVAAQEIR
jgi:hypothetical protein